MDFQNVNRLNNRVNLFSGNLLPIAADNWRFPVGWRVHSAFIWLIELIHTVALIAGFILSPKEKALTDGTVASIVTVEASFMLTGLYIRRELMQRIIQNINDMLCNTDEIMQNIVESVLRPLMKLFMVYGVIAVLSIIAWTAQPVIATLTSNQSIFFYVDYNLPAAFSTEPFSIDVLIWSTVFMTIGSVYLFLKKFGVDIYMMHLVLLLTIQYRYTAEKLKILFQNLPDDRDESRKEYRFESERTVENELKALCHRHNTVLHTSFLLRKLLSVNFSLLYVNSVFRFCFVALLMSSVPSLPFSAGLSVTTFTLGSLLQFFLLCSSVQTLSDASTEITDKAFDEDWFRFGSLVKYIFLMLIMSNNLECKIAAVEKFNLSLPSFMTIMNQSYSIALLFLRVK